MSLDRRRFLSSGAATAILGMALTSQARAQSAPQAPKPEATAPAPLQPKPASDRFGASQVTDLARQLAARPYASPTNDLPDSLASLPYEQYVSIRAKPNGLVWAGEKLGFVIEPLHRGSLFRDQVVLYIVENGVVRRIGYEAAKFDFGKLDIQPPAQDIGFSGFRVFSGTGDNPFEFAIFQGATFFRAIARGQTFGTVSRALALKPGEMKGEEIPIFRAFWIEQPGPAAETLSIHALLDSESVSGAVLFTLRPGDMTIIDVEVTLFARVNIEHMGWGGMAATYMFSPSNRHNVDDLRQAVHDTNGLQMHNGKQEWLWRPLNNPQALQVSAFVDTHPRGFGMLQRDRDLSAFQDDSQHYETRPSLWIEPLGEWGAGTVQLIEIPTDSEVNDNILAYWRPSQPLAAGGTVAFGYRQYWCWSPPDKPSVAIVSLTRTGAGSGKRRRFLVEFTGDNLADAASVASMKPALTSATGALSNIRTWRYPQAKTVRVSFELDPGSQNSNELRLLLEQDGKPTSETWLYRYTP